MGRAKKPQHVVGDDGGLYQLVPVPTVGPRPGVIAAVWRGIMMTVKVAGWITIGLVSILFIFVKRK